MSSRLYRTGATVAAALTVLGAAGCGCKSLPVLNYPTPPPLPDVSGPWTPYKGSGAQFRTFGAVRILNPQTAVFAGYFQNGSDFEARLFRTRNAGRDWETKRLPGQWPNSLVITDDGKATITMFGGAVFQSDDYDKTWQFVDLPIEGSFSRTSWGVAAEPGGAAYVAASSISICCNVMSPNRNYLVRISDRGSRVVRESSESMSAPAVKSGAWVAVGAANSVLWSGDAGESWHNVPLPQHVNGLSAGADNTLFVATSADSGPGMVHRLHPPDGRVESAVVPAKGLAAPALCTASKGFLLSQGAIYDTVDGGLHWAAVPQSVSGSTVFTVPAQSGSCLATGEGVIVLHRSVGTTLKAVVLWTTTFGETWSEIVL